MPMTTTQVAEAAARPPGQALRLLLSFAYFFFLLAAYYVVRPLREEMGVKFGPERLQWLFTATFVTMVALTPVYGEEALRYSMLYALGLYAVAAVLMAMAGPALRKDWVAE